MTKARVVSWPIYMLMVGRFRTGSSSGLLLWGFALAMSLAGCRLDTTITDLAGDNSRPKLTISDISINEAGPAANFTISLNRAAPANVTISYQTTPGSALSGVDFAAQSGDVTILAGQRFVTVTLTALDDGTYEGTENFFIQINAASGAIMSSAVMFAAVSIIDDETAPRIFVADSSVNEGETLTFAVSLSGPSALPVAFDYATTAGTAISGTDYTAASGRFTFPALSTVMTIPVLTTEDILSEANETLSLDVSNYANATVGDLSGAGTIIDDDAAPTLSISDLTILEGETGTLMATLSAISGQDVVFNITSGDGTASAPGDYASVALTAVTIPAGNSYYALDLTTVEDLIDEVNETFTVTLTGVTNALAGNWGAAVTITDDDGPPRIFVTDTSVVEGGTLSFLISLDGPSGLAVTFGFQSYDGTATVADGDYTAITGAATLAAGALTMSVAVPTGADTKHEIDETLTVSLAAVVNADIGDDLATGTITNDDTEPVLSVADLSFSEGETGVFVATLSAPSGVDVVFTWSTANGVDADPLNNAVAPADFSQIASTVVTIPVGATFVNLPVVSSEDSIDENNEGFLLNVASVTGATPGSLSADGVIVDDEAPPQIFINDISLSEGATAEFAVTLSAASGLDVVFSWATANNTASQPSDFDEVTLTAVTIPAGGVSLNLAVVANQDSINEGDETFYVNLSAAVNAGFGDNQGVATIVDDDGPPQLLIGDAVAAEGGTLSFLVTLTAASGLEVSFDFQTADQVATTGEGDYTGRPLTRVTIPAGSLSYTIDVASLQDVLDESDETFFVSLSGAANAVILDGEGGGTITDDDAEPGLYITDASEAEGDTLEFIVSISAVSGRDVTFTRVTTDAGAVGGADYTSLSIATLTIPKGSLFLTIQVVSTEDTLYENNETFSVDLGGVSNATPVDGQGLGTITNDDSQPSLFIVDSTVTEGQTLSFTVSISTFSGLDVVFDATSFSGTATEPSDYAAIAASNITIPAGSLSLAIVSVTVDDLLNEGNETFTVSLSNISLALTGDDTAMGTITDDDGAPELFVTDADTVSEGQTSSFVISLSAVSGLAVSFTYQTHDDTAVLTQDYTQIAATVGTIPAGALAITVPVITQDDARDEVPTEYFTLSISGPTNATISDADGDGGIDDNDNPPQIFIVDATVSEGETGAFVVSISAVSDLDVDFNYTSHDGVAADKAVSPDDFTSLSASDQISAGALSRTISLMSIEDVIDEVDEKFGVSLSSVVNASVADDLAEGTITDDDGAPVLAIYDTTVNEGETASLLVSLSNPSSRDIEFDWATADDTAVSASDYSSVGTTRVTIPAMSMTASVSVVSTEDLVQEPVERFFVDVSNPLNATGTPQGTVTITDDDSAPEIFITDAVVSEGETLGFVISLSALSGLEVTFNFQSYDGTATTADLDYADFNGAGTVAAGVLTTTIYLPTAEDSKYEADETLLVSLSGVTNADSGDLIATGTINNDDTAPGLYVSDASVNEGDTLGFSISIDAVSGVDTLVSWATVDATATTGDADYTGVGAMVATIPAGSLAIAGPVETIEDTKFEGDETLSVTLTAPTGASIVDGFGLGTIINDDTAPQIAVYDLTILEGETGSFAVSLSALSGADVIFTWETFHGSAEASDFTAVPATLVTIGAGTSSVSLDVVTTEDDLSEANETFLVSLSAASGATIADALSTGTITDDDGAPLIYVTDASAVGEGQTSVFVVTLSMISGQEITFNYQTYDDTAVSTQDYEAVGVTAVTIPAGSLSVLVSVATTDDTVDEVATEYFILSLSGLVNVNAGDDSGSGGINDDDNAPLIYIDDVAETEGGTLRFTVSISAVSDLNVDFNYQTYDGLGADKAEAPGDYTALGPAAGQIPAGSLTLMVSVVTSEDDIDESNEKFDLSLSSIVNAGAGDVSGLGTINDDDGTPVLAIYDSVVNEGETAALLVSLSNPSSSEVVFEWSTFDDTALSASDYTQVTVTTVTIPALSLTAVLTVATTEDAVQEATEQFVVSLANPVAATGTPTGTATITDDDGAPELFVVDALAVTEGETSVFMITLSVMSGLDVSFSYRTWDGSAASAQDYTALASATATIPAGNLGITIQVVTTDDDRDEAASETYTLSISSAVNSTISDAHGVGTINDNDSPPQIFIQNAIASEGNTINFWVSLSALSDLTVEVQYSTYDGTATIPSDYTQVTNSGFSIPAGSLSVQIQVVTVEDTLYEANETLTVSLGALANVAAGDMEGTGTIFNDDPGPGIFVDDLSVNEGATGLITVSLNVAVGVDVSFSLFTQQLGVPEALSNVDYTAFNIWTTIPAGALSMAFNVPTIQDGIFEGNERFNVWLSFLTHGGPSPQNGVVTIIDDESAPPIFVSDAAVSEGGTLTFEVSLAYASAANVTFVFNAFDGTATIADGDYTDVAATYTITAGQLTTSAQVVTGIDTKYEDNETLIVSLSALVNASAGDVLGLGTITNDDLAPGVYVSDTSGLEGETLQFSISLAAVSGVDTAVTWSTADGQATVADGDYLAVSNLVVTIPAGSLTAAGPVITVEDTMLEGDEIFFVTLTASSVGTIVDGHGEGTITNDDSSPQLWVYDLAISEGDTGYFIASLSEVSGLDIVFEYETFDGTAIAADFTAVSATVITLAAGQVTIGLPVVTTEDPIDEVNETFLVSLSAPTNVSFADAQAVGTITDDDAVPLLFIADALAVTEGGTSQFQITLSAVSGQEITFTYQTFDATAVSAQDYTQNNGTVATIPAGSISFSVEVATTDDQRDETSPENYLVSLSSLVNVTAGDDLASGEINDNDDPPQVFVADSSAAEGETLVFWISLSSASDLEISFTADAFDGAGADKAVEPGDYTDVTSSITLSPGALSVAVNVVSVEETVYELDEKLTLSLSGLSNVTAGDDQGDGTITNDDTAPSLTVYDLTMLEGETGAFAVSLSALSEVDAVFTWETFYGSAVASDFTAVPATLVTIGAGTSSVSLDVVTTEDDLSEASETFLVSLSAASGATIADALSTGTITDDDGLPLLYISDASAVSEGQTSSFLVTLSAASGQDVSFSYQTYDNTAVSTQDYQAVGVTAVTIPAGSISYTITAVTTDDSRDEVATEYYKVSLSSAVNANFGDAVGDGGINDNDDAPQIFITDASTLEGTTFTFIVSLSSLSDLNADFNFQTYDDTAVAADYTSNSGTGQIVAGALTSAVLVITTQDGTYEGDETILVSLSTLVNAQAGDLLATGTITDDDTALIYVTDASVAEGGTFEIVVSLGATSASAVTFAFQSYDGTATTADSDYTGTGGTATIDAGSLAITLPLVTTADTLYELDEELTISLSGVVNAGIGDDLGALTITNDDPAPNLYITDAEAVEGDSLNFIVSIGALSNMPVTFSYQSYDGVATGIGGAGAITADLDYTAISGQGTIQAGALAVTYTLITNQDANYENLENLSVTISSATNASIVDPTGLGFIHNDDCPASGWCQQAYLKPGAPADSLSFGWSGGISGDTVVVGDRFEGAGVSGVTNGTGGGGGGTKPLSGGAYVFRRSGQTWIQEAYLKAGAAEEYEEFGFSSAVNGDTIVVGAPDEGSNVSGVFNGTGDFASVGSASGAAYVFKRTGSTWVQEAFLKAANSISNNSFGYSSAVSGDTIVVGEESEDSNSSIINGTGGSSNGLGNNSGAAYVFRRTGTTWVQEAFLKAGGLSASDKFGTSSSISGDTIVIGAPNEDSDVSGVINGTDGSGSAAASNSGAAYVFRRTGTTWAQEAYLKAADPISSGNFGHSSAVSGDTIVVGARNEDSDASGVINGTGGSNSGPASTAGAAYVFRRTGVTWVQEAYLKAASPMVGDSFGESVAIHGDTVAIGATEEDSNQTVVNNGTGDSLSIDASMAGAVYVFRRTGSTWVQAAYLKASDALAGDEFGSSVGVSGDSIVVGAHLEASDKSGVINGPWGTLPSAGGRGAAYVFHYKGSPSVIIQQAAAQPDPTTNATITFTAEFSKTIDPATFGAEDISESGSASGMTWTVTNTGDDRNFIIEASGGTPGYYVPEIAAGLVTDVDGNTNLASSPNFDNSVFHYLNSSLYISDATTVEGGTLTFVISITATNIVPVTFNYASANGSDFSYGAKAATTADSDYVAASGTGTIGVGTMAITIQVATNSDASYEGLENLTVGLSGAVNATVLDATGIGLIYNDDCPATGWCHQAYFKAAVPKADESFGYYGALWPGGNDGVIAISGDVAAVGVVYDASNLTGISNGTGGSADTSLASSGAAYIFHRTGLTWVQEAYLKAGASDASDLYGSSVGALGDRVVVGSPLDDSNSTAIVNGTGYSTSNAGTDVGAVYVYRRSGSTWVQESYLKPSTNTGSDRFGEAVSLSHSLLIVGAPGESAVATNSGAAYVFSRSGTTWAQEARLKAPNANSSDVFGTTVGISGDTAVIGAPVEESNATVITNGPTGSGDNSYGFGAGAAYVFRRLGGTWYQEAYIKPSNMGDQDAFGSSVAIAGDTIAVGAFQEDNAGSGIYSGTSFTDNNTQSDRGAVYLFRRTGVTWAQDFYVKVKHPGSWMDFGRSVALSNDLLVVGAPEDGNSTSQVVNGSGGLSFGFSINAGSAHVYRRTGSTWALDAALKSPNSVGGDRFGSSVAISGDSILVSNPYEDSIIGGVFNQPWAHAASDANLNSGAANVFYYRGSPSVIIQQASTQPDPTTNATITFTAEFSKRINPATFTDADITETGSASGMTWTITNTGDDRNFVIEASGGTPGYYVPEIAAGLVTDVDGNTNLASSPNFDNSVFYYTNSSLYISDAEAVEGGTMQFVVSITSANVVPVTFSYQAYDGSGLTGATVADSDYTSISGTGTIPPGALAITYPLATVVDASYENLEYLVVSISAPTNATILDQIGIGNIHNDDCPATGWCQQSYFKAADTLADDDFGASLAINGDTMVVGAIGESSSTTGVINGTGGSNSGSTLSNGAAYVYRRSNGTWVQEAYLKSAVPSSNNRFGASAGVHGDTIVIGAMLDPGNMTGVLNGTGGATGVTATGAAHVFKRTGNTWVQEAYLKPPFPWGNGYFGASSSINKDTIVIGADSEGSAATGVFNGTGAGSMGSAVGSGAAYVFKRTGNTWVQEAMLKAADTLMNDSFGSSVELDGDTIVVGATGEDSTYTGVLNGTSGSNVGASSMSGAVYVYRRTGQTWAQEAYIKAGDALADDRFGRSVSVSGDTIAVGAFREDSSTSGVVSGTFGSNTGSVSNTGAAYIFKRTGVTWMQEAYLKPAEVSQVNRYFGTSIDVHGDIVAVGANEDSRNWSSVINGTGGVYSGGSFDTGSVHVFRRTGNTWVQDAYIMASDSREYDYFGYRTSVDGDSIAVSAIGEDSAAVGVINAPWGTLDSGAADAGAAYVFYYKGSPSVIIQQASAQPDPTTNATITFTAEFSKTIDPATFTSADISETGSASGMTWTVTNTGDDRNFIIEASGGTAGYYIPEIAAGLVTDVDGNTNLVSSPNFDNSVLYYTNSSLYISDAEAVEGGTMQFVVSITAANVVPVTFSYQSYDGDGTQVGGAGATTADSDYTAISGSGTIQAGALAVTYTLITNQDVNYENLENLRVTISGAVNANILDSTGLGFIHNDDCPATGWCQQAYLKAGTPDGLYNFGAAVAASADTVVVGSPGDASWTTGVLNGTGSAQDTNAGGAGAAYVFRRSNGTWVQEAYLKQPADSSLADKFGTAVAIDMDTIVVGTPGDDTGLTGVLNGTGGSLDFSGVNSGAASIYKRSGATWVHQAYLKAGDTVAGDSFGTSVAVQGDTIVVGSDLESSGTSGVLNGTGGSNMGNVLSSGAAYVFVRTGNTWVQQAYLKPAVADTSDRFGFSSSIHGDTIAIGARLDDSAMSGVFNGTGSPSDTGANASGAVFVFRRTGITWVQEAYLKAGEPLISDTFGNSVAVHGDSLVVGANGEDSSYTGVLNGTGDTNIAGEAGSGAAYVFRRSDSTWVQEAYLKAGDTLANDSFGVSVDINGDAIVVGASSESAGVTAVINGTGGSDQGSASFSGASYVFRRTGNTWVQTAYLKASDTVSGDAFGTSTTIDGDTIVVGAQNEDANVSGVRNQPWGILGSGMSNAGAAYVFYYKGSPSVIIQQAAAQPDPTSSATITFTAEFSKTIDPATFGAEDISESGSASGMTWTVTNTGDDRNFIIEASGGTAGEYVPSVGAGLVTDVDGNTNLVSSPNFDNSVTYDVPENLFISDATTAEGGTLLFVVTISAAETTEVTFNYQTYDGTATSPTDYTAASGVGTVDVGALAMTIAVVTEVDGDSGGSETFTVTIFSAVNALISDATGVGTITEGGDCPVSGWCQQAYLKAADPVAGDLFGASTAISGETIVVGAYDEDSSASGVFNGTGGPPGTGATDSGAAYVYRRNGGTWVHEAALKAADPEGWNFFGQSSSIFGDTIAIGAYGEDSGVSGVLNGTGGPLGGGAEGSGAAYVFRRTGATWVQEAALKAADPVSNDFFGTSISISDDTIVVGAYGEDSSVSGVINGTGGPSGIATMNAGAAYVYKRTGATWVQEAAFKPADPQMLGNFGFSSSISGDTIVVGAYGEESLQSGVINGTGGPPGTGAAYSGAAYVFKRTGTTWVQEAALKAADPVASDAFGISISISGDTIVVGAYLEDSSVSGVMNGTGGPPGTGADSSGAAYVFKRTGTTWVQEAALKAAAPEANDFFGTSISISGDTIVVGAYGEDSSVSGVINGTNDPVGTGAVQSGAAYVFKRTGSTWVQEAALKAADPVANDYFGFSASVSGDTIVVGALQENSSTSGVLNGTGGALDSDALDSGAAYVFFRNGPPTVVIQQSSNQEDGTSVLPISFDVRFSKPINPATFTTGDIVQSGTAGGVTWDLSNSGNDSEFILTATTVGSDGTVVPTLAQGLVTDLDGFTNEANSSGYDNSVTYMNPGARLLTITDASATEGGTLQFIISMSETHTSAVYFDWSIVNGSTAVADFTGSTSGKLTIASGQLTVGIAVVTNNDASNEGDETFLVNLTNVLGSGVLDNVGVGAIVDDDVPPNIFISDAFAVEGVTAVFAVSLTRAYNSAITVNYASVEDSALDNSGSPLTWWDFNQIASGVVTIAAGSMTSTVRVTTLVNSDGTENAYEQFFVDLSTPSAGNLVDNRGVGVITESSAPPTPALRVAAGAEVVEGGVAYVTVTINGASASNVSFTWQTYSGSATSGVDFTAVGATVVTIPSGEVSKQLAITTTQDSDYESMETFLVSISTPVNATIGTATGLTYIHNDDCPASGWCQQSYLKAADPVASDSFGISTSVSGDTIVIGANSEDSGVSGVLNGTGGPAGTGASDSGAAYVFRRTGATWVQEAALKAADPVASDSFGISTSISGDTIVIGANSEDSGVSGVLNGTGGPAGTGASDSGAAYVFRRTGATWVQEAALKAADPVAIDNFGYSPSISGDTIVIGANSEDSGVSGVLNGTGGPVGTGASDSGAAYVFRRTGATWVQEAALKAADPVVGDRFGSSTSISGDTIVIGAFLEDSGLSGVLNGTGGPTGTAGSESGAAYVYRRTGTTWVQEAALKAANPMSFANFGGSSSINGDTIVIGASTESSSVSGVINGTGGPAGSGALYSGAAYVFRRTGTTWVQEAALKAADPVALDFFGFSSSISGDTIVIGAYGEDSSTSGVLSGTGGPLGTGASESGAAYVYRRTGTTWVQEAALKAADTVAGDYFGYSSSISGDTIVIGSYSEDSSVGGVLNAPYGSLDNSASASGAAYVFYRKGSASVYIQQGSAQPDPTTTFPITFTVEFSKKIDPATFNTADITQTGTATGVNWTITNSGDDRHFTLTATSSTTDGTIIPTIPASSVIDVDGNTNLLSSPNFDNSVTKNP